MQSFPLSFPTSLSFPSSKPTVHGFLSLVSLKSIDKTYRPHRSPTSLLLNFSLMNLIFIEIVFNINWIFYIIFCRIKNNILYYLVTITSPDNPKIF